MTAEQFSLKWNNHTEHIVGVFESLLQSESLVDVTLFCEGQSLRAHKLILSACSPYFKTLFQDHAEPHPIVILKDVKFGELRNIIQFMYKGEVQVDRNDINSLISTAESLEIRGLAGPRATVTSHFPPTDQHQDPPMRPDPADGGGASQERKRPLSDLNPGGGGGEPPPDPSLTTETPPSASSNGEDTTVIKRPKTEADSGGEDNSMDGGEVAPTSASQLCQPELLGEEATIQDPQLQVALSAAAATNPAMAAMNPANMTAAQREAMQQQMQMLQEYMLPMISNITMGMTMAGAGVDVISNTTPVSKTGMSGLSCTVCAMIMPDLPTLEQHLRIHEEEKPYKCIQCGQRYKYQSAYQRHIDMNHTARLPQEKPYRCEVCGQFFKYLKSFHKHRANHTAIDRILNTSGDDSAISSAAEFPATRVAMPSMVPPLPPQLPMAGRPCLSAETMEVMYRGAVQPPPLGLAQTQTQMQTRSSYGNKSLAIEDEEEPNSVTITAIKQEAPEVKPCPEVTLPPQATLTPQKQTANQRTACSAVGQSTSELGETSQSETQQPPDSPEPPMDEYSAEFQGDDAAPADGATATQRSWICPYCLKGFRGKENLKLHIRTHTGEKPYECGSCDKRFVGKSDLNRHLRIHTGEKPYECNICFRRFARGDYLSKHVVTHGQGETPPPPIEDNGADGSTDQQMLAGDENNASSAKQPYV